MGLLDIAPAEVLTKEFTIRGGTLVVRGVKNKEWIELLKRFPDVRKLINGDVMDVMEAYLAAVDGLIPAIIATGLGVCGDTKSEELVVERLSEAEQYAIFEAVMVLGATEKNEARKKANPLPQSPETGNQTPNGSLEPTPKMDLQQPSLL